MASTPKSSKPGASLVDISSDNDGQRIDNFLLSQLKGVPKSHVYRLLRSGQVRVNSGRKKPSYRLKTGDSVRLPPVRMAENKEITVPDTVITTLLDARLYEDDDLLVINKPSGIPVHSGSGYFFGVIEALRLSKIYTDVFLELAHRIDRETSGCLVLVKNRPTLTRVNKLFSESKTMDLQKYYQALVMGQWPQQLTTVDLALEKKVRGGEHMIEVDPEGSKAISHFYIEESFKNCTLMNVKIETGRTHQIRVHAASTGHPVAGDKKYGETGANKKMKALGLKRLFLHARRLELQLDKTLCIEAPLSNELETLLDKLK